MSDFFRRLNNYGLFIKMFVVMVVSIVSVSVLITFSTLQMSEKLFMETFSITNSKVINQIKTGFETFNYTVVLTANYLGQSGTVKRFLTEKDGSSLAMSKSYYNMKGQMNHAHSYLEAYEAGITVLGANGRNYRTNRDDWPEPEKELANHPITLKSYDEPNRLVYYYDESTSGSSYNGHSTIIASKALQDRTTGKVYGVMYVGIPEAEFKQFYVNYTSIGNDVLVVNNAGKVVSSNRDEIIGRQADNLLAHAQMIEEQGLSYKNIEINGVKQVVLAEYLPELDMYIVNLIDQEVVMRNIIDKKTIILISMSIVAVALLFVFIISRRMTKSLTGLVKQISNMSKSDFDLYVTVSGNYETRQLATAFNDMLDELHEYVEQLIATQKKQRNAELEALQQQINPHFLYNTLASVNIMVQRGEKDKASEMIHALISLLQNTIGNVSETITVEQELLNMKNYAFINQVRYGGKIRVNYYISPDCLSYELPKLIIQPFIENAFFHGFNIKTTGFIHIMIGQEAETLVCEVVDNGDGMEVNAGQRLPNYKSKRQLFSGIGVKNVHERIKLLYGDTYGVEVSGELGVGTKVKIRLPIIETKDNTINKK